MLQLNCYKFELNFLKNRIDKLESIDILTPVSYFLLNQSQNIDKLDDKQLDALNLIENKSL